MTSPSSPRWLRPQSRPEPDAGAEASWNSVSEKLAALYGRPLRLRRRMSFTQWVIAILVVAAVLAAFFAVEAVRYNHDVLDSKVCPTPTRVNATLGIRLDTVAGVRLSDLQTCRYSAGTDANALSIDASMRSQLADLAGDQCGDKPRFTVAGHEACSMSGTRGTTPRRPSLLVRTSTVDWQLTTNLASVSMTTLRSLAATLLDSPGNPLGTP